MTGAALLLVATIASIELIRATGLMSAFGRISRTARRALRIVPRMRVSEWAKERALRLVSARLLVASLKAGFLLFVVAAPLLAIVALDTRMPLGVRAAMTDWPTRIWLLGLTCAYALARRHMMSGSGNGERLLQRIALGNRAVLDTTFSIERRLYPARSGDAEAGPPVFIAGLARAGTTILTRMLHDTGAFASLTYRDLPFPLAPNLWARFARNDARRVASTERGHGDGMTHDLDSPEAIEEMFWLCHEGDRYRHRDGLRPVQPEVRTIAVFRDYARLIRLRYGKPRYLSKNNANILRLPALVEAFPDAILLHPFRDPVEQSLSLLNQHVRACSLATADPYRRDFMRWLGHHEFGADHRPFLLGEDGAEGDATSIDYWLKRWIAAYRFLLKQPETVRRQQVFIDYDGLCASPESLQGLTDRLRLERPLDGLALRPAVRRAGRRASPALVAEAYTLYADLLAEGWTSQTAGRTAQPVSAR
jgi:hypothetical protein